MLWDGRLLRMVEEDGLCGVTSNPAIFEKAISKSTDYTQALKALAQEGASAKQIIESLVVSDLAQACDVLRPVYEASDGWDGFVSLEVSPHLAHDTHGTVEEALRLSAIVARENLMIKVPATPAGLPAIETLIELGVPVNVTLLFDVDTYQAVFEAYQRGLERRASRNLSLHVPSVASFFVSRIDSAIDPLLAKKDTDRSRALLGKVAIANARRAYQRHMGLLDTAPWQALAAAGARPQRLLWASTSAKNPDYRDVLYVEELVAPNTVNTIPAATFAAFRDHGIVEDRLVRGLAQGEKDLDALEAEGIDLKSITDTLLRDGVVLFCEAFDRLVEAVETKRRAFSPRPIAEDTFTGLASEVDQELDAIEQAEARHRIWKKDGALWSPNAPEKAGAWLGWIDAVSTMHQHHEELSELVDDWADADFDVIILAGMGGSSLAAEVFDRCLNEYKDQDTELRILDTTVPSEIARRTADLDWSRTGCIIASKSGTTLEAVSLEAWLAEQTPETAHLAVVTDPDTALEERALEHDYFRVYTGFPDVGGRFSALTPFGMVPAAAIGLDPTALLDWASDMTAACGAEVPPRLNPGLRLGAFLAAAHRAGRNKLTLLHTPGVGALAHWIEQLVAESTGKDGTGILPVCFEPALSASTYGADRVFVATILATDAAEDQAAVREQLRAVEAEGHPVAIIDLASALQVPQEMYRWCLATAVLGCRMGINPFDQPNVESAKRHARSALTDGANVSASGPLSFEFGSMEVVGGATSAPEAWRAHLAEIRAGGYLGLLGFLPESTELTQAISELRAAVATEKGVATTFGYGPRYLHSTGQLHKGGFEGGVFVQLIEAGDDDIAVPGTSHSFRAIMNAQAKGDADALREAGRPVLTVYLRAPFERGVGELKKWLSA